MATQTYREFAARCRAVAAGLDELGVGRGERVAVVSENSARLLELLFGVTAYGRICVPINFRLQKSEIEYIVGHCGASVLIVDPEHDEQLADLKTAHRFVLGADYDDPETGLLRPGREPVPWENPDEDATAAINYTSGTTARPKGVQLTHRNMWINAVTFGLHTGVSDRDVYIHTLPMFHCNGWGMPFTMAGYGRAAGGAAQGRRRRNPAPGATPRRQPRLRSARRVERRPGRGRELGRVRFRAVTGCASWSPGHRRRPAPSPGSRRSSAGNSPRSTG